MAKTTGIPTSVTIDNGAGAAKVITNDVTDVSISTPRGVFEVTGLNSTAVERLMLLCDGTGTLKGVFNTAADMSHAVLSTTTSSTTVRTLAIGYPGATLTMEVYVTDYAVDLSGGKATWSAPFVLANGVAPAWS
jgi:hypothetical protein